MKQSSRLAHLRKWHSRTTDGGAGWQAHREHRAFARLAGHSHVAAHQARELAGDGEPQPSAAKAPRGQGIGLGKFLEQLGLLLGCHSNAGIGHCEFDPIRAIGDFANP
jgi:hypothetical protein